MSCAEVRRELERLGLLLLQDKKLPSVATIFAGGTAMSGSWWSHPRGRAMFRCLSELEEVALVTRLINGKVTYVHKRLWPALAGARIAIEDEVHTESGRHEKRIESSAKWSKRLNVKPLTSAPAAKKELEAAATALGAPLAFLPWRRS